MPTPDDLVESREQWLQGLRDSVAEQVAACQDRLDGVLAALDASDRGGPLPVEVRAFFAAEVGVDLVGSARYLQRAAASCGRETSDDVGGVVHPGRCLRLVDHKGECDADPASLVGSIRARAVSSLRSMMVAADDAAEVEFLLHQAAGNRTSPLSAEDVARLARLAESFDRLGHEMRVLRADMRHVGGELVSNVPEPHADRLAPPARRSGPDASSPGLGGLG